MSRYGEFVLLNPRLGRHTLSDGVFDEAEFCERIAIMDSGRIVALDTPEALRAGVAADDVQARFRDLGIESAAWSPEEFDDFVRAFSGAFLFGIPLLFQVPRMAFFQCGEV